MTTAAANPDRSSAAGSASGRARSTRSAAGKCEATAYAGRWSTSVTFQSRRAAKSTTGTASGPAPSSRIRGGRESGTTKSFHDGCWPSTQATRPSPTARSSAARTAGVSSRGCLAPSRRAPSAGNVRVPTGRSEPADSITTPNAVATCSSSAPARWVSGCQSLSGPARSSRICIAPSHPSPSPHSGSSRSRRSYCTVRGSPVRITARACSRRSASRQPPESSPAYSPSAAISMRAPALR